jgi:FixJ family two-component response regulator
MPSQPPLLAVVDDDADVRIALVRLVSSAGFAAESFATGAEFLLSIERHVPDCLILDLQMPGMSGFDVQAALARNPRGRFPVVVITGHDSVEARNRAHDLGAHGYLPKPVDHEALLAAVEDAMGDPEFSSSTPRRGQ